MANLKLQRRALAAAYPKLGDLPAEGAGIQQRDGPFGRGLDAGDDKVGIDHLVDDHLGGPRLGDVGGQLGKQGLQVRPVGVMATWEVSGSVAQALRVFTSRPPESMRPMQ